FSAPDIGNENDLPPSISEEVYARAFRRRQVGRYPEVPTGNGFCMLIRRAALNKFGGLDAEAFPRGYGEENDFCMRPAGRMEESHRRQNLCLSRSLQELWRNQRRKR
ncbi:glycosyltransferase family 2 protein, partial [Sulfitobacter profundi]|uniref:glycosyltransferase family 2 protein n=1 Tax=Sulfitobacter profundi TaxID=2679961 RepID=UPI0036DCE016